MSTRSTNVTTTNVERNSWHESSVFSASLEQSSLRHLGIFQIRERVQRKNVLEMEILAIDAVGSIALRIVAFDDIAAMND